MHKATKDSYIHPSTHPPSCESRRGMMSNKRRPPRTPTSTDALSPVVVSRNIQSLVLWCLGDSGSRSGFRGWTSLRCCSTKWLDIVKNYCQSLKIASLPWITFKDGHAYWGRALLRFTSLHFVGLLVLNIDAKHSWGLSSRKRQIISHDMFLAVLKGCPMLRVLKMCTGTSFIFSFVITIG